MKSGILRFKNSTILQAVCAGVAAMVKLQHFVISDPDEVHHRCRAAIQQLTAPVVTNQFGSLYL